MGKGFDKILPKAEQLKQEYFEIFLPELMGDGARNGGDNSVDEEEEKSEAQ